MLKQSDDKSKKTNKEEINQLCYIKNCSKHVKINSNFFYNNIIVIIIIKKIKNFLFNI